MTEVRKEFAAGGKEQTDGFMPLNPSAYNWSRIEPTNVAELYNYSTRLMPLDLVTTDEAHATGLHRLSGEAHATKLRRK